MNKWIDEWIERLWIRLAFWLFRQLKNHFVLKSWRNPATRTIEYQLDIIEIPVAKTTITEEELIFKKLLDSPLEKRLG